ncbi:MAG: NifU family protein [Rickettsiales bacterium]
MYIRTEETPNPQTMKFLPDMPVSDGESAQFNAPHEAFRSPLAKELFLISEVTAVYVAPDFVSVTKAVAADWSAVKIEVLTVIMDHLLSGKPALLPEDGAKEKSEDDGEENPVIRQIKEIIDTRVRPAVAMDGGDIIFRGFSDGIVRLEMRGACAGCPSSSVTLKNGVESMLKHYVPEVEGVEAVD